MRSRPECDPTPSAIEARVPSSHERTTTPQDDKRVTDEYDKLKEIATRFTESIAISKDIVRQLEPSMRSALSLVSPKGRCASAGRT